MPPSWSSANDLDHLQRGVLRVPERRELLERTEPGGEVKRPSLRVPLVGMHRAQRLDLEELDPARREVALDVLEHRPADPLAVESWHDRHEVHLRRVLEVLDDGGDADILAIDGRNDRALDVGRSN